MALEELGVHPECAMKDKWAILNENLKNMEQSRIIEAKNVYDRFNSYIAMQSKVNTDTNSMVNKLHHYIYEDGLNTKLAVNKQIAASEIDRVEVLLKASAERFDNGIENITREFKSKLNWLWVGMTTILFLLMGNILAIIYK
jgi:hypothetical protein